LGLGGHDQVCGSFHGFICNKVELTNERNEAMSAFFIFKLAVGE
jgi:hypothetical protein